MKVIGIGDNVVDDYAHIRTIYPGGNALNFAVYASMLDCESAYLGVFGSDEAAEHVQRTLGELMIDTSHCRTAEGPNGRAILSIEDGERVFLSSNEGGVSKSVSMEFIFDDTDYLQTFAVMHTSAYSYLDPHLGRLQSLSPALSYDFSDDFDSEHALSLCCHVDIGFFSCAERSEEATMALLENAANQGCGIVVATRGPHGAMLFDGQSWFRQAPRAVTPVDTLGAGDAFITGFLISYLGGNADTSAGPGSLIQNSLDKGAAFAADICRLQGAFGHGLRY